MRGNEDYLAHLGELLYKLQDLKPRPCIEPRGGFIENAFPWDNYEAFLKESLRHSKPELPFRGPKTYQLDQWLYLFSLDGDYRYFTGREQVIHKGKKFFRVDLWFVGYRLSF